MMLGAGINPDDRVLVMAPTRKDALTADSLLRDEGIAVEICHSFDDTLDKLARGAAAIVIPEEAVTSPNTARLLAFLRQQPPWSDLPILVLTRMGADSAASNEAVRTLGNVTLLERPVRVAALLTAVRTALRARQRQYQIREHLFERARTEAALRDADQRKDEFLATLGHELRNPLAPLVSGLDVLRMTVPPTADSVRMLGVMDRQIRHLRRLVDDLLELSRVTRGLTSVRHDPLDLRRGRPRRDRHHAPDLRGRAPRGAARSAGSPGPRAGRRRAADAGLRQPADEHGRVHGCRRPDPRDGPAHPRPGRRDRARQRHRN